MSSITIKTKRVKSSPSPNFSMDETPTEQFLNSPYPYYDSLCSPSTDHFDSNVYLGNFKPSGDIGNSNWQNNPYGNFGAQGTIPAADFYNNNGPLMDYSTPKPFVEGSSVIDINNNVVGSNSYTSNYDPNINNTYPTNTSNSYYDYIGSSTTNYTSTNGNYSSTNSNYASSSAALSSFTVPSATVDGAATNGIASTSYCSSEVAATKSAESQPDKSKEDDKQPQAKGIANSVMLAPMVAQLGDGIPTGVVPARVPGGKDTKIAIATDSILAPAKHHIARIFNKHGITTSFSPNMEKLTEITGNVAYLFCLYQEYCRKRRCKMVKMETYGKIFRNEFKRKVGVR